MRHDRRELKQLAKGLAFLSPWLIDFVVFTLLPAGMSAYFSLTDYSLIQQRRAAIGGPRQLP